MAQENISSQLNDLLASRDFQAELLDKEGRPTDAENAEIFTFDFVSSSGKNYGTMVVILDTDNEMQVFYGDNLGRSMEGDDKTEFFDFVQHLHKFANMRRWTYSPKNINQVKYTMQGLAAIKEGLFEGYYGTRKVSYSGEPTEARLVIQHNRALGETDARFRYVESLFIETADAERFRLQFKNLAGGRAMLEHVRQGGKPYDVRGSHITEMVAEIATLSRFNRASAGRVLEGVTAELVTEAQQYYKSLRENLKRMGSGRGYQAYFESWHPAETTLQEELVDSIKTMFVEQTLDSRIEAALPVLARLQQENRMKEADIFESWAEHLSEGTWALPETPEQQQRLQDLMSRELIVGPDATNATEQLDDLVGDDILFDRLSDLAARDASANIWADTDVQARLAELGIQLPADAPSSPGTNAEPDPEQSEPVQESRTKELAMDLEDPLMSDEEFETKYGDSRAAMQGRAGRVQDRRSGEWYDPAEKFDQLKNSPEFQAQMKRMARREGGFSDEEHSIRDDGNEGRPGKQRYPGKLKEQGMAEDTLDEAVGMKITGYATGGMDDQDFATQIAAKTGGRVAYGGHGSYIVITYPTTQDRAKAAAKIRKMFPDVKLYKTGGNMNAIDEQSVAEGDAPVDFDWYRKQQQRQTQAKQKPGVAEGSEERSQHRLWQMITDYEQRAKRAPNDIKKQRYLQMAKELRDEYDIKKQHYLQKAKELRGPVKEQGVAEGEANAGETLRSQIIKLYKRGLEDYDIAYDLDIDEKIVADIIDDYDRKQQQRRAKQQGMAESDVWYRGGKTLNPTIPELEEWIKNLTGFHIGGNLTDAGRAKVAQRIAKAQRILAKKKQQQQKSGVTEVKSSDTNHKVTWMSNSASRAEHFDSAEAAKAKVAALKQSGQYHNIKYTPPKGVAEASKEKTPGVALSKAYQKDFDGIKPANRRPETALTGTYSKTGKPGGELKKPGVAETALKDKEDLAAKRRALQDLSRNPGVDQKAVQQRQSDLEKEARSRDLAESLLDEFVEGLDGDQDKQGMAEGSVTKQPQPYNDPNWTKNLPKEKLDALAGRKPPGKKSQGVDEASGCNHTMEGEMCPEHGLAECGMHESQVAESQAGDALLARIKSLALLR